MFGIHDLPLFIVSCILLNMTPGQDTMYILGRSLAQGRKAGILSAMGIMTGVLVHTLMAACGLSALLAASAVAFSVVKYAGAAYLIWIGIGYLRKPVNSANFGNVRPEAGIRSGAVFRQGVLTNVLNPKVSLFFLSFLPQFVSPAPQAVFVPFLLLGMVFFTTGSIWCLMLVYGASWIADRMRGGTFFSVSVLKKAVGVLFVWLGIKLALSRIQ